MEAYLTICPYYSRNKSVKMVSPHVNAGLTGRKWVKSAFEVMEVSRFWREVYVDCVAGGEKYDNTHLDEKITRVNQSAVTVRTRAAQWCKLNLLTRTVNEA
jgi:hypothetical protein